MSGLMLGRSSLWKASTRFLRAATASTRTCPATICQGHSAAVMSDAALLGALIHAYGHPGIHFSIHRLAFHQSVAISRQHVALRMQGWHPT